MIGSWDSTFGTTISNYFKGAKKNAKFLELTFAVEPCKKNLAGINLRVKNFEEYFAFHKKLMWQFRPMITTTFVQKIKSNKEIHSLVERLHMQPLPKPHNMVSIQF